MQGNSRPLAVVIGATSGIGYEWAKSCARNNYDLIVVADDPEIFDTANRLKEQRVNVEAVEANLARMEGLDRIFEAVGDRNVYALLIHVSQDLGKDFLKEDMRKWRQAIDASISGTMNLVQRVARNMTGMKSGLIIIEGPIDGQALRSVHAVESGIKAFLHSFTTALRQELKDTGITLINLMPGETGTLFLERGAQKGKEDNSKKYDPSNFARMAFKEMLRESNQVISSWQNMMQTAMTSLVPPELSSAMQKIQKNLPIKEVQDMINPMQAAMAMPRSGPRSEDEYEDERRGRGGYGSSRRREAAEERPRDEEGRFLRDDDEDEAYRSRRRRTGRDEEEHSSYRARGSSDGRRRAGQERLRDEEGRFTGEDEAEQEMRSRRSRGGYD